ncbi:hypothetical protein FHR20_001134 [Sphingomonas leidyi]|uniref:Uncharacterized protein n=1 Tax=Sphingomonas leidyi TaxID=68569 RepID=A0A7X5UXV9_9SPHN|nr:hypothetical protein [Sphingomonas leidyi]NIJ64203.1 hypothetical protein [Sphingomonas leidyi]
MRDLRSPYAYNDFEIVQECEESNRHGARSSYYIGGEEFVWSNPESCYLRATDMDDWGEATYSGGEVPYSIEHPTHTRFRCLYCSERMAPIFTFHEEGYEEALDRFFSTRVMPEKDGYERTGYNCYECGWWLIDIAYTAPSDDDLAWALNESILCSGGSAPLRCERTRRGARGPRLLAETAQSEH